MKKQKPAEATIMRKSGATRPGDVVIEIPGGSVLQRSGKLYLCTCKRYEWKCRENPNGDTICSRVCVVEECKQVPADRVQRRKSAKRGSR
jgi:hypothetical protein